MTSGKIRRPWPTFFLAILTFGFYFLVWYYKVNRELSDYGRKKRDPNPLAVNAGMSTFWMWTLVGGLFSWWQFLKRLELAHQIADIQEPRLSKGLGYFAHLVGVMFLPFEIVYVQPYLNLLWKAEAEEDARLSEIRRARLVSGAGYEDVKEGSLVLTGRELLVVSNVKKYFPVTAGIFFKKEVGAVKAVDDISFAVNAGETLGIVGESGCGKSTLARCVMRLLDPTAGSIFFDGRDISRLSRSEMRPVRREMMMIFQDPYASLNARKRVGFIVAEPLEVHGIGTQAEQKRRVQELLEVVGLNPEHYNRFPHEFSGGQRQRIGIARALTVNPKLIVCDEPVSALDVSVQAQVLNLLKDLQKEFGLTYVFIAHDLNVVRHISDRVMVMYLGKAAEVGSGEELYATPRHPYTGALLSAVPIPNPALGRKRQQIVLEGDVPNPINPPSGCRFHPRCPRSVEGRCDIDEPALAAHSGTHEFACHFPLERWPMTEEEIRHRPTAVTR